MRKFHGLARVAPLALLLAGPAFAQTPPPSPDTAPPPAATPPPSAPAAPAPAATATAANGKIIGVVTDASTGKPVPGALVIATGPGGEQTAVTDAKGAFQISGLGAGRYKLAVQLEGFNPAERADLDVKADQTLRANLAVVPSAVQMEEVVVTGSRIRRKDLTTPAPVTVINTEQLAASGKITLGDFLQTLPEAGNGVNTQVNNGGAGATQVNLRGLSNLRTLVLINGRRTVFTGIGGNTGTGVDLNTIPPSAIERIEVLKDGASAVYGSDAIGGVVNIITKKPYNGVDVGAFTGISSHSDGFTYDVNFTTSTSGEKGGILFSGGYTEQQATRAPDRAFSRYQLLLDTTDGSITRIGSSRVPSGRISAGGSAPGNALWQQLKAAFPNASTFTYDPSAPGNVGGYRPFNAGGLAELGEGDLYNFQNTNYLVTPSKRINLFASGDAKLMSNVRAFFESSYVNRNSAQQLAPEPLIIGAGGNELTVSSESIYNPFGRDFTSITKRLVEFGNRRFNQDLDTFRVVGGLNGTVPVLNGAFWDVSLNYGRTTGIYENNGSLVASRIQAAVGPSFRDANGVARCGTPAAPIPSCVPLDLFHGASITPAQVAGLGYTGVDRVFNELLALQANSSTELFRLLADRPVGLAVGYEYRLEAGADTPNPVVASFDSTGNNRAATSGRFHVNEGYAELSVPVVSNLPFVADLEATAAARAFNYSTFGTDWTYKFGGRWRVIPDVTFRGTYSTAFRAPSINELYLGNSDNFPNVSDPCAGVDASGNPQPVPPSCVAQGLPAGGTLDTNTQLRSRNGGNPALKPETAKAWTIGTVLEPRAIKNFSITLDYYNIKLRQAISTFGAGYTLGQCYPSAGAGDPASCALIQRDATGAITNITDINVNVGGIDTSGADLAIRYRLDTRGVGAFGFGFDGTWLQKITQIQPGGRRVEGAGTYDFAFVNGNNGQGGVFPRFKANAGVTWGLAGFGAGVNGRFLGKFRECGDTDGTISGGTLCADNPQVHRYVSPYALFDLFVSYDIASKAGKTGLAIGVRNVFDTQPPVIYNSFTPTSDPTAYDFMGRFFYANLSHRI